MKPRPVLVSASNVARHGVDSAVTLLWWWMMFTMVATVVTVSSQQVPSLLYTTKFVVQYVDGEAAVVMDDFVGRLPVEFGFVLTFRCDFGDEVGEVETELVGYDADPTPSFTIGNNNNGSIACCNCFSACFDDSCSDNPDNPCCSFTCPWLDTITTNITTTISPTTAPSSVPIRLTSVKPTYAPFAPLSGPATPAKPTSRPLTASIAPPNKAIRQPSRGKRATTKAPLNRPLKKKKSHRSLLQVTPPTLPPIFLVTQKSLSGNAKVAELQFYQSGGIVYVKTNDVDTVVSINGMFNISSTCSSNATINFLTSVYSPYNNYLGTTFRPNTTITKTKSGSLCCPAATCTFCFTCKIISTGRCCGKPCPF